MKFNLKLLLILIISFPALSYVGPGAGLSAIGTIIAFLGAIFLMIFGLLWYPIKRMYKKIRGINELEEKDVGG